MTFFGALPRAAGADQAKPQSPGVGLVGGGAGAGLGVGGGGGVAGEVAGVRGAPADLLDVAVELVGLKADVVAGLAGLPGLDGQADRKSVGEGKRVDIGG